MRKIIRNLLWLLFVFGVILFLLKPLEWLEQNAQAKRLENRLNTETTNTITYLISQGQWLTFDLPSFTQELKFLSTANFREDMNTSENILDIRYSLTYQFLSAQNEILSTHQYHFRTAFKRYVDANNTLVEKSFYLDSPLHPNASQSFLIALKKTTQHPAKIRLKIATKDAIISDVGVRSYFKEITPPSRYKILWERMSLHQRLYLSRGNIYEIEQMRQREKYNLVSSLWKPNGPIGVEGEDYEIRRLFILKNRDDIRPMIEREPILYSDANLSMSRYLLEGNYSLTFTPLTPMETKVNLSHYDDRAIDISRQFYLRNQKEDTEEIEFKSAGVLDINSTFPLSIAIAERNNTYLEPLELRPIKASGYYRLENNTTLDYTFYSPLKRFVRIECRSSEQNSTRQLWATPLHLLLKDKEGKVIQTQTKQLFFLPSRYDYTEGFIPQSQRLYLYIELSQEAKSLHLSSPSPTLYLRLASRSENMIYRLYSFRKEQQPEFTQLSSWFTLRPDDFNHPTLLEREITLNKQTPPPLINPDIALGKFDYEQLLPQDERWYGHHLLLNRPLGEAYIRPQSWGTIYTKLESHQPSLLKFQTDVGLKEVAPHLLYTNFSQQIAPISLYLDDVVVARKRFKRLSGDVKLPLIALDTNHTLAFSPHQEMDFYINHTTQANKDVYFRRMFIRFTKPLHFQLTKTSTEESLGFQLALSPTYPFPILPFRVSVKSKETGLEHQLYHSFSVKNYQLNADIGSQKAIHITHRTQTLLVSDPMYLKLGENLPIGDYTITVYPPETSETSYLYLNHLILGDYGDIGINKEIL